MLHERYSIPCGKIDKADGVAILKSHEMSSWIHIDFDFLKVFNQKYMAMVTIRDNVRHAQIHIKTSNERG